MLFVLFLIKNDALPDYAQVKTSVLSNSLFHGSFLPVYPDENETEDDFDDVISSQREINRLRQEVQRLDAEARHWKQLAQSQVCLTWEARYCHGDRSL